MRRWTCPRCGAGKLAPERPRKDDARRYCLPCTDVTGRLVERECAALEAKRGAAKQRAAEKAKRKRATARRRKAREAERVANDPKTIAAQQVQAEFDRIVKAAYRMDQGLSVRLRTPELSMQWSRSRHYVTGRVWAAFHTFDDQRVTVTLPWPPPPWSEVRWLLTHEVAHLVPGATVKGSGSKRILHGPTWQAAFCRLAETAHGIDCWSGCGDTVIWSRDRGVDRVLRDALPAAWPEVNP